MSHVKNITVSVPEEVYRAARIRAAHEDKSLSALVADCLRSLDDREAEFSRREAQQKQIQAEIEGFSARHNIDRDSLHDRAVR